jgi:amino acid adenylation domain-containing protein
MLVHDLLFQAAQRAPEAPALRQAGQVCDYGELAESANSIAAWLLERGLSPGDRVATIFEKSIANCAAILGVWRAGGVLVNLNDRMPPAMLGAILADCEPVFVLGSTVALRRLFETNRAIPPSVRGVAALDAQPAPAADRALAVERLPWREPTGSAARSNRGSTDLCTIMYTSGSTGRQKGVMWSHRNLVDHVTSVTTYLKNTAHDRLISVLPLYFGYGLSQLITSVGVGASLSLVPSFTYPNEVVEVLSHDRITGMAGVPSHFQMLLEHSDLASAGLSALRYITLSGSKSPPSLVRRLGQALPHVQIYLMFGQTESTIRSCYLDPGEVDRRPESIGKAIPNVEVLVVDEFGRRVADGEVGELVCRGTNVMLGYWNDPALTAKVLRPDPQPQAGHAGDKVLFTGDLVRADRDGFLYFVGRRDEMIKVGAHRVFPAEVEAVLADCPGVIEAAVVAEPDAMLGAVVAAHVVAAGALRGDARAILAFCRKRLPDYMIPRRVYFHEALPKTATGKVLKGRLRSATAADANAPSGCAGDGAPGKEDRP